MSAPIKAQHKPRNARAVLPGIAPESQNAAMTTLLTTAKYTDHCKLLSHRIGRFIAYQARAPLSFFSRSLCRLQSRSSDEMDRSGGRFFGNDAGAASVHYSYHNTRTLRRNNQINANGLYRRPTEDSLKIVRQFSLGLPWHLLEFWRFLNKFAFVADNKVDKTV